MIITRGRAEGGATLRRADTFTGAVWTDPVLPTTDGVTVNQVVFAPAARTHWHRHQRGQLLLVTTGFGLVQARGGPVEPLRAGDAVWVPPGETHWHGAGPGSLLVHLAISLGVTEWLEPVPDAEVPDTDTDADSATPPPTPDEERRP